MNPSVRRHGLPSSFTNHKGVMTISWWHRKQNQMSRILGRGENYFGEVLSKGDVNGDGFDDLLIGSPQATWTSSSSSGFASYLHECAVNSRDGPNCVVGSRGMMESSHETDAQRGSVSVILASRSIATALSSEEPNVDFRLAFPNPHQAVIGSSQQWWSSHPAESSMESSETGGEDGVFQAAPAPYERCGQSIAVLPTENRRRLLVIGCPGSRKLVNGWEVPVGRVIFLDMDSVSMAARNAWSRSTVAILPVRSVYGSQAFGGFGYSLASAQGLQSALAISAPWAGSSSFMSSTSAPSVRALDPPCTNGADDPDGVPWCSNGGGRVYVLRSAATAMVRDSSESVSIDGLTAQQPASMVVVSSSSG